MKTHHTKDKGDIGVLKAAAHLAERGYLISNPMTEHAPFDLIIYKDGLFWRLQVKYRSLDRGAISVNLSTTWNDRNGNHKNPIDRSEIDAICVYEPKSDSCCFFSPREINNTSGITIRFEESSNNQTKGVRFVGDFGNLKNEWAADCIPRSRSTMVSAADLYPVSPRLGRDLRSSRSESTTFPLQSSLF